MPFTKPPSHFKKTTVANYSNPENSSIHSFTVRFVQQRKSGERTRERESLDQLMQNSLESGDTRQKSCQRKYEGRRDRNNF